MAQDDRRPGVFRRFWDWLFEETDEDGEVTASKQVTVAEPAKPVSESERSVVAVTTVPEPAPDLERPPEPGPAPIDTSESPAALVPATELTTLPASDAEHETSSSSEVDDSSILAAVSGGDVRLPPPRPLVQRYPASRDGRPWPWLLAAGALVLTVAAVAVVRPFSGTGTPAPSRPGAAAPPAAAPKAGEKPRIPFSNQTPVPEKQPTLDSLTPNQGRKGDWVLAKGSHLGVVLCSGVHPEGLDPRVWMKPVGGGDRINQLHFNDARYTDGNRDNGDWSDTELYFQLQPMPPGKYKFYIKTDCATTNELDFEVLE